MPRKVWKSDRDVPLTRLEFNVTRPLVQVTRGKLSRGRELLQQNWPLGQAYDRAALLPQVVHLSAPPRR